MAPNTRRSTPRSVRAPSAPTPATRATAAAGNAGPSNPELFNPALPDVRLEQSFAYGSSKTPVLPKQLILNENMTLTETLEAGLREADERLREQEIEAANYGNDERENRRIRRSITRERESSIHGSSVHSTSRHTSRAVSPEDPGNTLATIPERDSSSDDSNDSPSLGNSNTGNETISYVQERNLHQGAATGRPGSWYNHDPTGHGPPSQPHINQEFGNGNINGDFGVDNPHTTSFIARVTSFLNHVLPSPIHIISFLVAFLALFGAYLFRDGLREIPTAFTSYARSLRCGGNALAGLNTTEYELVAGLSTDVDSLNHRFNGLRGLVNRQQKEIQHLQDRPVTQVPIPPLHPLSTPRVNFCSIGQGAVVNPYLTTPTKKNPNNQTFLSSIYSYITGRAVPPPIAALQPWEDVGDCWCSEPIQQKEGSESTEFAQNTQLSIILGRSMFPDELVIEHIPRDATLAINAAPKNLELWAEFDDISDEAREALMRDIGGWYLADAKDHYDDILLGPKFLRLAKFRYMIREGYHHVQKFSMDVDLKSHDLPIKKIVVRAKNNYGAGHTCFYRVRLHGEVAPGQVEMGEINDD